ncbi:MAG TPA: trypsin-like peptidase domain-containing protein [Lacipirellulaceae bacterium]
MVKQALAPLIFAVTLCGLSARGGETVLLDFASPTCGPCQQMMPTVESLQQAGYPIRRVDVTREPELAAQFHVDRVPCFVMLSDGNEVDRLLGATSRGQLEQMIQRAGARRGDNPLAGARTASPESHVSVPPGSPAMPRPSLNGTPSMNAAPAANVAWTGAGPSASRSPGDDISRRDPQAADLVASTVRIRVDDPAGRSFGTGTIVDARSGEALIITCGHLFRDSQGKGPVTVDLFTAGPEGARTIGQVTGQVISYNLDRDIGLVSIKPGRPVRAVPIAASQASIERGAHVISVGCDHGQDPTALASWVTATNRYKGAPNVEANGAPIEGRSGGGLFSTDGSLVGICFAADYEGNEGLYKSLDTIHDELDRVGLSFIYRGPADGRPSASDVAVQTPTAGPDVIRFKSPGSGPSDLASQPQPAPAPIIPRQEPSPLAADRQGITPLAAASGPAAGGAASATAPNLNSVEQAAFDEIIKSASTSKVVCIVRSKEPGGESEVITLDAVSPEFVRTLETRAKVSTGPSTSEVICIIRPNDAGGKSEVITLDSVSPEFVRNLASRGSAAPATMTR